jgi:hypothetical protein
LQSAGRIANEPGRAASVVEEETPWWTNGSTGDFRPCSQRTIFCTDLAGSFAIGNMRMLDLDFRLGWQHDYANTARPITASFSGVPGYAFTVYGATPSTDSALVGVSCEVGDRRQYIALPAL